MLITIFFMMAQLATSAPTADKPNPPTAITTRPEALGPLPILPTTHNQSLDILPRSPKNPENEAGGRVTYPWHRAEPTFNNAINATDLALTRECLALWCEQDVLLDRETGLASCFTNGRRPEGGVRAYVCNFRQVARCSRHDVDTAARALEEVGSMTGLYHHVPTKKFGIAIGFDRFCEGSGFGCGRYFDPMFGNCQEVNGKMWGAKVQFEKEVVGVEGVGGYEFEGVEWVDE